MKINKNLIINFRKYKKKIKKYKILKTKNNN